MKVMGGGWVVVLFQSKSNLRKCSVFNALFVCFFLSACTHLKESRKDVSKFTQDEDAILKIISDQHIKQKGDKKLIQSERTFQFVKDEDKEKTQFSREVGSIEKATTSGAKEITRTKPPLTTITFNEEKQIIHLPEMNYYKGIPSQKIPTVILSQFQLFHTLLKEKAKGQEFVVFLGRLAIYDYLSDWIDPNSSTGDLTDNILLAHGDEEFFLGELIDKTKEVFWKNDSVSIPDNYEELTNEQKDLLLKQGATYLLFYLRELENVYKVMTEPEYISYIKNRQNPDPNHPVCGTRKCWDYDYINGRIKEHTVYFLNAYKKHHGRNYQGKIFIVDVASRDLSSEFSNYSFDKAKQPLSLQEVSSLLPKIN